MEAKRKLPKIHENYKLRGAAALILAITLAMKGNELRKSARSRFVVMARTAEGRGVSSLARRHTQAQSDEARCKLSP
jgi:hypothetical protein